MTCDNDEDHGIATHDLYRLLCGGLAQLAATVANGDPRMMSYIADDLRAIADNINADLVQ